MVIYRFFVFTHLCVWMLKPGGAQHCGVSAPGGKIIGGVDSGGYRYPWFALLLLKKISNVPIPVCAGSLITRTHVLTAAHCFNINPSTSNKDLFAVAMGVYDICSFKETAKNTFNVDDVFVHEKYQRRGKFYDIALMKLDRPADFTVICLPVSGVPDVREPALIMGFGATDENSDRVPCHMMEVNVTKYSHKDCSETKLPMEDRKERSVICAGAPKGGADSCFGDSGGPLLTRTSAGRYVIAGIVSYGYGCGVPDMPGVYTNVGSYLKWIENRISGSKTPKAVTKPPKRPVNRLGVFRRAHARVAFPLEDASSNSTQKSPSVHRHGRPDVEGSHREPPGNAPKMSKVTFPD